METKMVPTNKREFQAYYVALMNVLEREIVCIPDKLAELKKEIPVLKERIVSAGAEVPEFNCGDILLYTSMFGSPIKPVIVSVCGGVVTDVSTHEDQEYEILD